MKALKRGTYKFTRGEHYGTPKEVWGFLTRPSPAPVRRIARQFLDANTDLFEFEPHLARLEIRRVIHSLGATHVILSQTHCDRHVHRGYVTVHTARSGRVYYAKNRSVPARLLPPTFEARIGRDEAVRRARRALPKKGRPADVHPPEQVWLPRDAKLQPAWKVRLTRRNPREEWIVYVNARNGANLSRYDNLQLSVLQTRVPKRGSEAPTATEVTHTRFVPNGIRSHRARLGLSAEDYGRLVGASAQTIYNWERETSTPRAE